MKYFTLCYLFYHFKQILAIDQDGKGLTSSATLKIEVEDVNDNFPKFDNSEYRFTVPSSVMSGDVVGRITARDDDATEPNNQLLYLLTNDTLGKFRIDINTGRCLKNYLLINSVSINIDNFAKNNLLGKFHKH